MTKLAPIHPGVTLKEDFMDEHGLSANKLAGLLDVPANRVTAIVNGARAITADTALRLERLFGVSATFWLNLQKKYELDVATDALAKDIKKAVKPFAA